MHSAQDGEGLMWLEWNSAFPDRLPRLHSGHRGNFAPWRATSRNVQNDSDSSVAADFGSRNDDTFDALYLLW